MTVMTRDDFDDDPYRTRVLEELDGPVGSGGIAGPNDGFPAPAAKPQGSYNRDKFVQGWRDSPFAATEQGFRDYMGQSEFGAGINYGGGDKFTDPTGRMFDVIGDYGTAGAKKRTGYTTDKRYADVTGSGGSRRSASGAGRGATGAGAPAANSFLSDIRNIITQRLGALKGTPSIDDPELAAQSSAYRRSQTRSDADERAMLAERAAANGTLMGGQSSGGFDTALQGIHERSGENQAAYDADLVGDEVQYRRAEMQGLLDMALQSGDSESARELSMALAELDAQLRREGLGESGRQFDAGLAQRGSQFNAGMDFDRYRYDDGMGRTIGRDAEDDYRFRVLQGLG
jgi:hypothetical protein